MIDDDARVPTLTHGDPATSYSTAGVALVATSQREPRDQHPWRIQITRY